MDYFMDKQAIKNAAISLFLRTDLINVTIYNIKYKRTDSYDAVI